MASARRHDPIRTCVGCGKRAPQRGLLRLRASADGRLSERESTGRSAYLHATVACVAGLARSKHLVRALRRPIAAERRAESATALLRRLLPESQTSGRNERPA